MYEPKDYVMRLIRRLAVFLARMTGLIGDKKFRQAQQEIQQELLDLTGLPAKLIEQVDGPMLAHFVSLHDSPEKTVAIAQLFLQKGIVTAHLGDPVEARRLVMVADHCLQLVNGPLVDDEWNQLYRQVCRDVAYELAK
jgi:hypothetical protein